MRQEALDQKSKRMEQECTFSPKFIRKSPSKQMQQPSAQPAPPPPAPLGKVLFTCEVDLPNGDRQMLEVRQGEDVVQVATMFANKYQLDEEVLGLLRSSLVQEFAEHVVEVEVMVRDGEKYALAIPLKSGPGGVEHVVNEFVEKIGLEHVAGMELMESVQILVRNRN
jgi:hypothetical protein